MEGIKTLAKAFLVIDSMSHKKLQKLCFYAKAWYLALYDENLINDDFQAWVHGAVNPDLYYEYKDYGFSNIPKYTGDLSDIPETFLEFSKEVYDTYGKYTGDQLELINHNEDPWKNARGNLKPWERCITTISEEDIKEFYRKQMNE